MGNYKKKNCKYCNKEHRKRGPYCSQSCSNSDRVPTDNMREAMRKVAIEYNQTPEAIAKQKQINTPLASLVADDYAIEIPTIQTLDDFYEHTEGLTVPKNGE